MDDSIDIEPDTLKSWEKYHSRENLWTEAAELNTARAYAGVVTFNNLPDVKGSTKDLIPTSQYIYLFGGLCDFAALNTIERYDSMLDYWKTTTITLPWKLAKAGVSKVENNSILIFGGIYSNEEDEFNYIDTAYKLDFINEKWSQYPNMNDNKELYSIMPKNEERNFHLEGLMKVSLTQPLNVL